MKKKNLYWIIGAFVLIFIMYCIIDLNIKSPDEEAKLEDDVSISESYDKEVTDGCIEEWEDYEKYIGEKIEEASNRYIKDDTHYLLKDVWGYIEVYYLDEEDNEYLYKKTSIATDYLSKEDIDDLKIGIEVVGTEALNSMLENFE